MASSAIRVLFIRERSHQSELKDIQPIGEHHPLVEKQIEVVKEIRSHFHEEFASFYNIFSPISYLKPWFRTDHSRGDQVIADLIKEDPKPWPMYLMSLLKISLFLVAA